MNAATSTPDRSEQHLADLSTLTQVAAQINRSLDLEDVLTSSLEGIQRVTDGDFGCFLLIQPDARTLHLASARGLPASLLESLQHIPLEPNLLAGAFAPESQLQTISALGQRVRQVLEAQGLASYTLLPLTARGRTLGILLVGVGAGRILAPPSVDLLTSIGEQIGMAIENARLYEQTQRRVQELEGLAQLSAACVATLNPQEICDLAVEWTRKLLRVSACILRRIEEGHLHLCAVRGQREGIGVPERLDISALSRFVIEQRAPHIIANLETETTLAPQARQLAQAHGIRSSVAVPLIARDQVTGILRIADDKPRHWSKDEIDLLQTIANQVANALDNARLLQSTLAEQRKVQAIFDSGLSGLYVTDAMGRIVMFNRAAERITGWTLEEARGKNWADLLSDRAAGNPIESLLDEALLRKTSAYVPSGRKMRTKDGRLIPAAKAVAPLLDEKGNVIGAVGAFWDLSKEQRAEIEYENFLALVTHQLRSPLSAVLSALELFERRDLSKARRAELWAIIKTEGEQLKKLADQFLEQKAATQSSLPLHMETLSIGTLARALIRRFQTMPAQHRFRIRVANPEPLAFADANRVEQVLRNLLDNAVSYSPVGSCISVVIKPQDADWLDVSVRDQGIGIPVAEQDHIFQPFYRAPQTITRRGYSHGLGLALAKEMVTAMGGRIWVDSEPGRGATFHFTLRRAR